MARKQEQTVNLVRKQSGKTYRVVEQPEMLTLRSTLTLERTAVKGAMYGYFYVEA